MLFGHSRPAFPINGLILVGVCAAGKSTIATLLRQYGVVAHPVAQEHSAVPTLFMSQGPRRVVFLDAELPTVRRRRRMNWTETHYRTQRARLQAARVNANLIVRTDPLTPAEVAEIIVQWSDGLMGLLPLWDKRPRLCAHDRAALRFAACGGESPGSLLRLADNMSQARRRLEMFHRNGA